MTHTSTESIRPHPSVAPLRCRSAKSTYRGVYEVHCPRGWWVAKVKVNGRLMRLRGSTRPHACQAALFLVEWYRERYGDDWARVLPLRKTHPPAWKVWFMDERKGWVACVWEFGRQTYVTGKRKRGRKGDVMDTLANCRLRRQRWRSPGRLLVFRYRDEAEAAAQHWGRYRWGLFAADAMWRW